MEERYYGFTKLLALQRLLLIASMTILLSMSCKAMVSTPLNPIESALLRSRLDEISVSITDKYRDLSSTETSTEDTFIFPGAGGVDVLVEELCAKIPNSKIVDWSEHRGSIVTAAYHGEAVGEAIANLVLQREQNSINNNKIHFIGISVGAFCANAAATRAYKQRGETISVKLTLLDPFCGRGIFGSSYGKENFGKFATTAIQILNTDDPMPMTNEPLPHCYCLDVTGAPERNSFVPLPGDSMHSWPVAYRARHYQELPEDQWVQRGCCCCCCPPPGLGSLATAGYQPAPAAAAPQG